MRAVLHLSDERDLQRDQGEPGRVDGGLTEAGQRPFVAQVFKRPLYAVENIKVT